METEIEVRRGHVDLFLAGLRAMGIPHRASRSTSGWHRVFVATEDAVPAQVILRRVAGDVAP